MTQTQSLEIVDLTSDAPIMTNLRSKVWTAVARYRSSRVNIPPFSVAEIMVMAWVCRKKQSRSYITDEEVSNWTIFTFRYYEKMALEELYKHSFQHGATEYKDRTAFHNLAFERTIQLERIDVPLEVCSSKHGYSSTTIGAQRFLRRVLGEELTEFKDFFKLPVEVRVLIYEEVFRSRVDGLQYNDFEFHPNNSIRGLRLSQRGRRPCWNYHEDYTQSIARECRTEHWSRRKDYPSATEPTSQLMALLRVNRQVFEEAMPVFYGVNHFHVRTPRELTNMLTFCGERRRPHFTSISFGYSPSVGPKTANKAFRLLKDIKRLRRLEITAFDASLKEGMKLMDCTSLLQLPGIEALRSVRVRELYLPPLCPLIEAYLRPTMVEKAHDEVKQGEGKPSGKGKSYKSEETVYDSDDA